MAMITIRPRRRGGLAAPLEISFPVFCPPAVFANTHKFHHKKEIKASYYVFNRLEALPPP